MHLNATPAPKPRLNLLELAEVDAKTPAAIAERAPLPVLESHLYGLALARPHLIEEVEFRLGTIRARRAAPLMQVSR